MSDNYEILPEHIRAVGAERPRLLLFATALASAAVAIGFTGLLGIYIESRSFVIGTGGTWLPRGVTIPLTQPNMMMFTLIFSALTMAWAIQAIRNADQSNFYIASATTLVLGFAYLAQSAYLLSLMGIEIAADAKGPLFYALIGTHMALMVAALAYLAGMTWRAMGGNYSAKDVEGIYGASMFWYTTVGLYLVLWYVVYITK